MSIEQPTTLDLFCGAGGITEGFRQAGFRSVFGNDFNQDAINTFKLNHPETEAIAAPIESLDPAAIRAGLMMAPGELDCLVGGPPCQGFSINAPERFLEDPRNSLFRDYLRFVEEFQPKTFLLENVPGMLSLAKGAVVQQIIREFSALGYNVTFRVLFAAHYGVPQERWRLIVLGSRVGKAPAHPVPTHFAIRRANFSGGRTLTFTLGPIDELLLLPHVTVLDALGDLPELEAGSGSESMPYDKAPHSEFAESMRAGSDLVRNHVAPKISEINQTRLTYIQPGGSWRDIPHDLLPEGMKKARRSDHTRRYGRLAPTGLSGTVMTKMDPHWGPAFHFEQSRTLSVREAARLQSFPDRYLFTGPKVAQYEQVGNAVPVLMARAVAGCVAESLAAVESEATDGSEQWRSLSLSGTATT